ncbi:hypothetical protein KAR48_09280 [bacterium]|nr:hypothetical protein [bacterium]
MWTDAIVEEIRKYRDEHASKFNYDINKIYKDLKEKEKINTNKKITLKPKIYLKSTGA